MGSSKTAHFNEMQNRMASKIKALGHPARLAIIEHLLEVKSCICGDIVSAVPLAQATISQHLKALKAAGIIQGKISGTAVCYCLSDDTFGLLEAYFGSLRQRQSLVQTNCC